MKIVAVWVSVACFVMASDKMMDMNSMDMPNQPPVMNGKALPLYFEKNGVKYPILYDNEGYPIQPPILPADRLHPSEADSPYVQEYLLALRKLNEADGDNAKDNFEQEGMVMDPDAVQQIVGAPSAEGVEGKDYWWAKVDPQQVYILRKKVANLHKAELQASHVAIGLIVLFLIMLVVWRALRRMAHSDIFGYRTSLINSKEGRSASWRNRFQHYTAAADNSPSSFEKLRVRVTGGQNGLNKKLDSVL